MKASTPELMKFKRLQRRLSESKRGVIGLLEGLWLETAKNCPQGDIGKFANEEIAIMCDWDGDPQELIDALVDCRWLDVCEDHRLVVHDWSDHCPKYVKGGLAKQNKDIAIASSTKVQAIGATLPDPRSDLIASTPEVPSTKPSQAKPNQAKPSQAMETDSPDGDTATTVEPREVFDSWNERAMVYDGISVAKVLTSDRAKKLRTRLSDASWPWREAIDKLPLPRGPDGNWQPDLDWLIKNDLNARKLAEGAYDWRASSGKRQAVSVGPGQMFDPKASEVGF